MFWQGNADVIVFSLFIGLHNVMELAKQYRLRIFVPSTIGAFGPESPRNPTPNLTIQRPKTIYGVSKVIQLLTLCCCLSYHCWNAGTRRVTGRVLSPQVRARLQVPPLSGRDLEWHEPWRRHYRYNKARWFHEKRLLILKWKDYAVQIFHDALKTGRFQCYLKPDTRLPMMYITDALRSLNPSKMLSV